MIKSQVLDRRDDPFASVEFDLAQRNAVADELDLVYRENMNHAARNPGKARGELTWRLNELRRLVRSADPSEEIPLKPVPFDVLHSVIGHQHNVRDHGRESLKKAFHRIHEEWQVIHGYDTDREATCPCCGRDLLNGGAIVYWEQPCPNRSPQPDLRCGECRVHVSGEHSRYDQILDEAREQP